MGEEEKDGKVRVEDRRHFDRDGNPVDSAKESEPRPSSSEPSAAGEPHEKVSLVSVLFSYIHSALIFLGDVDDPIEKKTVENLEGARQMIDILEMLQAKTRGNLTPDEARYLESALFDLRMRYLQKSKILK